jgi:predicted esterase
MPPVQAKAYRWSEGAECFVYAPAAPLTRQGQQHPVLCFLHGRGEALSGGNPDGVAAHGSPAWHAQTGSALTAPFLVVCPQRRDIGRWDEADAAKFHLVLDKIIADHNGHADKIFLTGFSLGGDAVFWFASYPRGGRFRRLWAVDPALQSGSPVPPPGRPVLLHYGSAMQHLVGEFKERAGLVNCPDRTMLTGDRLICDLRLDHVATCRTAYGEEAPYKWLLRDVEQVEAKV